MKKNYQKPQMRVVELQHHPHLLQSSGDQWLNYAPGLGKDENQLT